MKKTIPAFVCAVLFAGSCTVINTRTTKSMDITGAGVIHKPVIVDLVVDNAKVSGSAVAAAGALMEQTRQEAVANALENVRADVLVEPVFKSSTIAGRTTITVIGWPANYKNFRQISNEDIPLLQTGLIQKANVYEPQKAVPRKGGGGAALLGVLLGLGILGLILLVIP